MKFFEEWVAMRMAAKKSPLGEQGKLQASIVWKQWLDHCGLHTYWPEADATQVAAFVAGISSRAKKVVKLAGKKRVISARRTAPATQRRYWRIIRDIYAYAVQKSLIEENPASGANRPDKSERTDSLALNQDHWRRLHDGLPSGHTFLDRRNRMALLLLSRCALTTKEIVHLTHEDVIGYPGSPEKVHCELQMPGTPLVQPESQHFRPLTLPLTYVLRVKGRTEALDRLLVTDVRTSKAIEGWLEIWPPKMSTKSKLLLSEFGQQRELTARSIYNICRDHMKECLKNDLPRNLGPNALRNTCIAIWLNSNVPVTEVMRRCGLSDTSFIYRLKNHIRESSAAHSHAL